MNEKIINPDTFYVRLLTEFRNTFEEDDLYSGSFVRRAIKNLIIRVE